MQEPVMEEVEQEERDIEGQEVKETFTDDVEQDETTFEEKEGQKLQKIFTDEVEKDETKFIVYYM